MHAFDPPVLGALVPETHPVYLNHTASREATLRKRLRDAAAAVAPTVPVRVWVSPDPPGDAILEWRAR